MVIHINQILNSIYLKDEVEKVSRFYQLFPNQNDMTMDLIWREFVKQFFKLILNEKIFFASINLGKWVTRTEAIIFENDPNFDEIETQISYEDLLTFLLQQNFHLCFFIPKQLQQMIPNENCITPYYLISWLLKMSKSQIPAFLSNQKISLLLLNYCVLPYKHGKYFCGICVQSSYAMHHFSLSFF